MKLLIKIALALMVLFSLCFVLAEHFGLFNEVVFQDYFKNIYTNYGCVSVGICIVILLALDLILPLPSSILMTISGYYCGVILGTLFSFIGAMLCAILGFWSCRKFGSKAYDRAIGESQEDVKKLFENHGPWMILISRGFPMLTEIISCLAGLSKMSFGKFIFYSIIGTLPICFVYAWAGSVGNKNPNVAVAVSLGLPAFVYFIWFFIKRYQLSKS